MINITYCLIEIISVYFALLYRESSHGLYHIIIRYDCFNTLFIFVFKFLHIYAKNLISFNFTAVILRTSILCTCLYNETKLSLENFLFGNFLDSHRITYMVIIPELFSNKLVEIYKFFTKLAQNDNKRTVSSLIFFLRTYKNCRMSLNTMYIRIVKSQ